MTILAQNPAFLPEEIYWPRTIAVAVVGLALIWYAWWKSRRGGR